MTLHDRAAYAFESSRVNRNRAEVRVGEEPVAVLVRQLARFSQRMNHGAELAASPVRRESAYSAMFSISRNVMPCELGGNARTACPAYVVEIGSCHCRLVRRQVGRRYQPALALP